MKDAISKVFETVNGMLKLVGGGRISEPANGDDREKLEYLIEEYRSNLIKKVPVYAELPEEVIPDAVLAYLIEEKRKRFQSG